MEPGNSSASDEVEQDIGFSNLFPARLSDAEEAKTTEIEDRTETNLVALRRTIYLAIQSSLDFEECAHKLLKMEFDEKDYVRLCSFFRPPQIGS